MYLTFGAHKDPNGTEQLDEGQDPPTNHRGKKVFGSAVQAKLCIASKKSHWCIRNECIGQCNINVINMYYHKPQKHNYMHSKIELNFCINQDTFIYEGLQDSVL